ncbi:uncharacterized protein LOC143367920 [Andrena cerasifolii]|uniref:uncharacterized protein LOC143367920 n=1 Tax=Andrena cerasifolii TaxID=2819439 RepID=UPI0040382803
MSPLYNFFLPTAGASIDSDHNKKETAPLRTDVDFRSKTDKEHHNGTSIIEKISGIHMINSFPLDYMHLICLGVVKKLLSLWCCGKPRTKISLKSQCKISLSLINLSGSMPKEFMRKPRSLDILKRWKATEFRQFLLYTGPVVLLKNISDDRYLNFLALHAAFVILTHRKYFSQLDYAVKLLEYFVESFELLYDPKHVSHNVHNLLHLVDDVRNHGPVDEFSCFPFENFLQSIKKCIRKSEEPLQQIVKRQLEKSRFSIEAVHSPSVYPIFQTEHSRGPLIEGINNAKQFKRISFSNFILQIRHPNNCCRLNDGSIIIIENIIVSENEQKIIGRKFLQLLDFYDNPCNSTELGIFQTPSNNNLGPRQIFNVAEIAYKCVKLETSDNVQIFPLLHSTLPKCN